MISQFPLTLAIIFLIAFLILKHYKKISISSLPPILTIYLVTLCLFTCTMSLELPYVIAIDRPSDISQLDHSTQNQEPPTSNSNKPNVSNSSPINTSKSSPQYNTQRASPDYDPARAPTPPLQIPEETPHVRDRTGLPTLKRQDAFSGVESAPK